jgi:hypothetical protein
VCNHILKINTTLPLVNPPLPSIQHLDDPIADSGSTIHCLKPTAITDNDRHHPTGLHATQPDGSPMISHTKCEIIKRRLPLPAKTGYKFENVKHNIISIPVLCDNGCEIRRTAANITVTKNGSTVMTGYHDTDTRLWRLKTASCVSAPPPPHHAQSKPPHTTHSVNALVPEGTIADMITFLHKAMFSPTATTLLHAVKNGHLATWPGMTAENIHKHLPKSIATALGHLDQQHKNTRSTKPKTPSTTPTPQPDTQPTSENPNERTHQVFPAIVDADTGKIFTDQTGKFPVTSSRGNKYVFVLYDYDSNAILVEPIKSRMQNELLRVYRKLTTHLRKRGLTPKLQRLDNECSEAMKAEMDSQNVSWQLTPVGIHRRNAAERAIRTFKKHFLAGLASTDNEFPLHLWCRLLPKAQRTLNLLRTSGINPRLSAEAQLNGQFDYNRAPLTPPGIRAVVHKKPDKRNSWDPRGSTDWYVGEAPHHYRCWTIYVSKTNAERIGDTVAFFPQRGKMPTLSSHESAVKAALQLTEALAKPQPPGPFAPMDTSTLSALGHLSDIFSATINAPIPIKTPTAPPRVPTQPTAPPRVPIRATPPRVPKSHVLHRYPTRSSHRALAVQSIIINECIRFRAAAQGIAPPPVDPTTHAAMINAIVDPTTGQLLEFRHLIADPKTRPTWMTAAANEFGRLMYGLARGITGTNTTSEGAFIWVWRNYCGQGHRIPAVWFDDSSYLNKELCAFSNEFCGFFDEFCGISGGSCVASVVRG